MTRDVRELDALYQDIILDHYRAPRNADPLEEFDVEAEVDNPFCGDEVKLRLQLSDGRVHRVSVAGQGCSISQSSGSLMGEAILGLSLDAIRARTRAFKLLMEGGDVPSDQLDRLGDLVALQGVRRFPVRIKCALLAWSGLADALDRLEETGES